MLKICFVGLGSIGTRHLRNLHEILSARGEDFSVDAMRSGDRPLEPSIAKLIGRQYGSFAALPGGYDLAFICNPTSLHYETIRAMSGKARHLFIEKPLFDRCDLPVHDIVPESGRVFYVAAPLRYTGVIQYLKEHIAGQRVYAVRAICSSYLPDWRKTLYQQSYSAHAALGGGVSIDLIHEWDYLEFLFGPPERVIQMKGTCSDLEIDSDDIALYIGRYPDKLVSLHLDYFGRSSRREVEVYLPEDVVVGDLIRHEIRWLRSGKTVAIQEERDTYQKKELVHFLDIINGERENDNGILSAYTTLRIAKGEF